MSSCPIRAGQWQEQLPLWEVVILQRGSPPVLELLRAAVPLPLQRASPRCAKSERAARPRWFATSVRRDLARLFRGVCDACGDLRLYSALMAPASAVPLSGSALVRSDVARLRADLAKQRPWQPLLQSKPAAKEPLSLRSWQGPFCAASVVRASICACLACNTLTGLWAMLWKYLLKTLTAEVAETSPDSLRFLCEFCFETRFSGS